jgi:hypothetical protein
MVITPKLSSAPDGATDIRVSHSKAVESRIRKIFENGLWTLALRDDAYSWTDGARVGAEEQAAPSAFGLYGDDTALATRDAKDEVVCRRVLLVRKIPDLHIYLVCMRITNLKIFVIQIKQGPRSIKSPNRK